MNEKIKDLNNEYGWICPKCGAVMSPKQPTCVFCAPTTIRYSINNAPYIDVDYTKIISQTESHYRKSGEQK